MMLIIKKLRENKKISQEYIAFQLGLSQSQYCRRENGKVKFLADEIGKLAKILDVPVSCLYGKKTDFTKISPQKVEDFADYNQLSEKLIEQYEARLKEKDELIKLLKLKYLP